MQIRPLGLAAALLIVPAAASENVREVESGSGQREAIALTVYNDDLALVRERRRLDLPGGPVRLALREVSAKLRPESALLRAVGGGPIRVREQDFEFDPLTPARLLEKYVGREVTVVRQRPAGGEEYREQATVLAAGAGVVLRFADRIETAVPGRIVFPAVPADLRDRPTLSVRLEGERGNRVLELSYLTGGLSWQADYVASLSPNGKGMDLSGWATITNRSGAAYEGARLQLVAGTVNRVLPMLRLAAPMLAQAPAPRQDEAVQEGLMDYHLYSFDRPLAIADNQSKQLALLEAAALPVEREYLLAGDDWYYRGRYGRIGGKLKPAVFIRFDSGQLGRPLPAGVVRVYAPDRRGTAQFVGEDRIGHTAPGEKVRLGLGEAFDLTAERTQTTYRQLGDQLSESAYRIEIRNAKEEAVTVRVQEPLPGDWEIIRETRAHRRESSHLVAWEVEVPAGGTSTLEYAVRVRW